MTFTPRIKEHVQWMFAALAPPNGGIVALTGGGMGPWSCGLPYYIPANRWLCITSAGWGSKFGNSGRASYFYASGLFTLPDNAPFINMDRAPMILPPTQQLHCAFINNETMTPDYGAGGEAQWVNCFITGFLVDHQEGMTMANCLEGVPL